MDRRRFISSVILLVLIGAQRGSDASWTLPNKLRRMLVTTPLISPAPAPISEIKSDQHVGNNSTAKPQNVPGNSNSSKVDGKVESNDTHAHVDGKEASNGTHVHVDKNSNQQVGDGKPNSNDSNVNANKDLDQQVIAEKCDASAVSSCTQNKMVACLKHSEKGSQDLLIVIQNEGDRVLHVSVTVPPSIKILTKELKILEHHVQKINVSTIVRDNLKIVLKTDNGECVLYTGVPISDGNFFQKIPSYANQVTPMHGAYFMFALTLVVGVTWACCKFGKKRRRGDGGGIPYQELEMALPQSVSAVNGDAEDGWDDKWDDDWDDGGAVKSPGELVGNLSANGLTSRSSNRDGDGDGWQNDWDD